MASKMTIRMMLDDIRIQLAANTEIPTDLADDALNHARNQMIERGSSLDKSIAHEQYEQTASTVLVWIHSFLAHERAKANHKHDETRQNACDYAESVTFNWRMIHA